MAMIVGMRHDPKAGVLCWGGPEHERIVSIPGDRDVWLFPVERRLTAMSMMADPEPMAPALGTVRYNLEWVGRDHEEWPVLLYPENIERLRKNLIGTLRLIEWACDPWRWTEADR